MTDNILDIKKLQLNEKDIIVITIGNNTLHEEAVSILTNVKNNLKKYNMLNMVVITTPNITFSKLTDEELDQIGLKRK